ARATLTGMSTATTREDVARAYVEGLLCSLAAGISALEDRTGTAPARITLIGGAARSQAVQQLAPAIFGREVTIAPEGEYVALGAARQAAWALAGTEEPPAWTITGSRTVDAEATPEALETDRGRTAPRAGAEQGPLRDPRHGELRHEVPRRDGQHSGRYQVCFVGAVQAS